MATTYERPKECPYCVDAVRCKKTEKHCEKCGWNPEVNAQRLAKIDAEAKANEGTA